MSYGLIWNPYKVVEDHHDKNTQGLRQDNFNALLERMSEIGNTSFSPDRKPRKVRK